MSDAATATATVDASPQNLFAAGVPSSAFGAAGQRCLAGSLLVLVGDQHQQEASLAIVIEASRGRDRARARRKVVTSRW